MIRFKLEYPLRIISLVIFIVASAPFASSYGQVETNALAETEEPPINNTALESLTKLLTTEKNKRNELNRLQAQLKTIKDRKSKISAQEMEEKQAAIKRLQKELRELNNYITSIATGVDDENFDLDDSENFNMQSEVEELIQPMIIMLKSVTADTRQIEGLRHTIVGSEHQREIAEQAIESINNLIAVSNGEKNDVKTRLQPLLDEWSQRLTNANNLITATEHQLQSKLASQESFTDSTSKMFSSFFRDRGFNFVLGLATFLAVVLIMRLCYRLYLRVKRRRSLDKRTVLDRVVHVLFNVFTVLFATAATLFVFNKLNDWLLLGILLIFLLAATWVMLKMLPNFVEQFMLLLNLGAVREGERIMFNGIPWKVKSLDYYTHLENPLLLGGKLVLPVRELIGLHSRPAADHEIWFPSREDDWVELDDGKIGRVVFQSPEMVQIVELGGAKINYTTENYLGRNPRNMSSDFRVEVEFGIDYKHQDIATTTIPLIMKEKVEQGLSNIVPEKDLLNVEVEFMKADTSALVYEVEADIRGSSAHKYEEVERAMASLLVDACNENGWLIPFHQVTLHQAALINS